MEAFFLDEFWDPLGGLVLGDKLFFNFGYLDEPAVEAAVNQWSLTSPAEWVAMLNGSSAKETTRSLKVGLNLLISVFDVDACVG